MIPGAYSSSAVYLYSRFPNVFYCAASPCCLTCLTVRLTASQNLRGSDFIAVSPYQNAARQATHYPAAAAPPERSRALLRVPFLCTMMRCCIIHTDVVDGREITEITQKSRDAKHQTNQTTKPPLIFGPRQLAHHPEMILHHGAMQ